MQYLNHARMIRTFLISQGLRGNPGSPPRLETFRLFCNVFVMSRNMERSQGPGCDICGDPYSIQTSPDPTPTLTRGEKAIDVRITKNRYSPQRKPIKPSTNTYGELLK